MFCDACGSAMSPEQRFCVACGKPVGVAHVAGPGVSVLGAGGDGRVAKHLSTLAMLWIVVAALTSLVALVFLVIGIFPVGHFLPSAAMAPEQATGIASVLMVFHAIFLVIGIVVLLIALVHFVAAWGLFHHAPWARILTIVFAFLRILEVPLGTALGIYTIWVLMGPTSEQEYRALGRT